MCLMHSQALCDISMHPSDIVDTIESPGHTSLICHHRDRNTGSVEASNRLWRSLHEFDPVYQTDVPMIHDNCAITIKKYPRPQI